MKFLISLFLVISSLSAFPQIDHAEVLIGKTEKEVYSYMDSLLKLKSNPTYKVRRDLAANGDLILEASFSINDEAFYRCSMILARFTRISGEEVCMSQLVTAMADYNNNINFVKDNFNLVSKNKWETKMIGSKYKIVATLELLDGKFRSYRLYYDLQE